MLVATKTSLATGHESFPPSNAATMVSTDTYAEGEGVLRKDDSFPSHVDANGLPCPANPAMRMVDSNGASQSVFTNGKPTARLMTGLTDGGLIVKVKPTTVFVGQ